MHHRGHTITLNFYRTTNRRSAVRLSIAVSGFGGAHSHSYTGEKNSRQAEQNDDLLKIYCISRPIDTHIHVPLWVRMYQYTYSRENASALPDPDLQGDKSFNQPSIARSSIPSQLILHLTNNITISTCNLKYLRLRCMLLRVPIFYFSSFLFATVRFSFAIARKNTVYTRWCCGECANWFRK